MSLKRIFVSLALGLAGTTLATAETPIIVLDSTELDLSSRSASKPTVDFAIPAKLNVPGVYVRRFSISQGGKVINPAGSKLEVQAPATLLASFNLANLNTAGAYVVTVEFAAPAKSEDKPAAAPSNVPKPAPAPADGEAKPAPAIPPTPPVVAAPTPPAKEPDQIVQFKLTKPAAELRVSTPLQLANTVKYPGATSLAPNNITLNEVGGKSFVTIDPTAWKVDLRRGSDPIEESRLTVVLPGTIDGFGQGTAVATLEGPISLGTTSGTLTVRSTQLGAQTVDFPLTIVTRIHACWLFPIIVVGIVLGWYFRNKLETKRARYEAKVPAEQEIAALDDLIDKTVDEMFKERFQATRRKLADAIDAPRGTPATITAATTDAAGQREKIIKEIGDLTNRLCDQLGAWGWLTTIGTAVPDDVAPALTDLQTTVPALARQLDDNLLSAVDEETKHTLPILKADLVRQLQQWLDHVGELELMPPQPWPDAPRLAATRQSLAAEAGRLRQAIAAADIAPDKLGQAMFDTVHLLRNVREQLFGRVLADVEALAETVRNTLRERDPNLKPQADAIDAAIRALPGSSMAPTATAADTFVRQLDKLRAAVVSGLQSAWNDTTAMPGLSEGRFVAALTALATKPPPGSHDEEMDDQAVRANRRSLDTLTMDLERPTALPTDQSPMSWRVVLAATDATVMEAVVVTARLIAPEERDPPRVTLSWYQGGNPVGVTEPGVADRTFRFTQIGPVLLQVTARTDSGEVASARLVIQVRPPHGASVIEPDEKAQANAERVQSLIAAAIILLAGWFIFSPTFVGTLAEFFAAFLWGFSVDIGAAKVRELTENVKALKPSIPIPKP